MCTTPAQEIDGLREAELAGGQIGTTKRGIGPAYASKATRNGIRVGELRDLDAFAKKLRMLAADGAKRFEGFQYDVEVMLLNYSLLRHTRSWNAWVIPSRRTQHGVAA